MPKLKPHKGLLKRIKVSARGKVMRRMTGAQHLMSGKTGRRRQRLRRSVVVTGRLARTIRRAVGA